MTVQGLNNTTEEQLAFRSSLMDFGINQESAEEIIMGGMSNIRENTDLNKESIKSFMHGLKSMSPNCPNPSSIHHGNRLSSRRLTWANWTRSQPLIGVKSRAIDWNANPINLELQQFRIKMMESSVKSQEKATPPELKDLTKFREWEEDFHQNLRYRFNSEGFPILLTMKPDLAQLDKIQQMSIQLEYDEDNNVVWRLLCDATRKGPCWEYVAHFQNTELNSGHARNAFISLMQHAYTDTDITMILNKTYQEMKESHYTGEAKSYDWNKHKRNWTAFHGTIMRFEKNHNERRFVWDFINSISDERLDAAKADAIDESKDYRDKFNECLILFTNRLGLKKLANGKHKRCSRSVYSVGTTSNKKQKTTGTFTGKLENKPYPTSVYKTMSKEQRQELYQMRQASKKKRALKAAETKKAKEAEKQGAGDSFDFDDGENEAGYCELDSHADTTAAGSNMVLLNPDQITTHVDVAPFYNFALEQLCPTFQISDPDQQPASTLKDVKGAIACGAREQTNTRAASLERRGRRHEPRWEKGWTIHPKESPRLASAERNQSENTDLSLKTRMTRARRLSLKYSDDGETDWNKQIAKSICSQENPKIWKREH
eukprot:jgi/Psemu1/52944/gm1.52944_g